MSNSPILIIGAGVAGLAAAIRLAAAGQAVTVLEQNAQVGGKMGEITAAGFRWDTGPSVITMRPVFEDLFRAAGRRLDDYLTLLPVEPLTRYFYPDGTVFDATRDLQRMAEQIARLDERDVEGYLAYLSYAARLHRITGPTFIHSDPVSLASFAKVPPADWPYLDGWRRMQAAINQHVRHPHLRQLLGRFATYVGASPFLAPATLNVIAHVEMTGGVFYPQGGVYAIARALERLARELGVDIRLNCPVRAITVQHGRAVGVQTAEGAFWPARAVIANVDVATVYEKLLPPAHPARTRALTRMEPSVSGFILLLGVHGQYPALAHHNIFFCRDYAQEFRDIFQRGMPPADPTIYVAITSKRDPAHAPPDHENWFVLVNAPPTGSAWDWTARAETYARHVLETLAGRHGVDVRGHVVIQHMLTPPDLERLTGARRGALYGASSNSMWAAFRRPHNHSAEVRGLYFAGGTAHPGGGVPMVMLSAAAAVRALRRDGLLR